MEKALKEAAKVPALEAKLKKLRGVKQALGTEQWKLTWLGRAFHRTMGLVHTVLVYDWKLTDGIVTCMPANAAWPKVVLALGTGCQATVRLYLLVSLASSLGGYVANLLLPCSGCNAMAKTM